MAKTLIKSGILAQPNRFYATLRHEAYLALWIDIKIGASQKSSFIGFLASPVFRGPSVARHTVLSCRDTDRLWFIHNGVIAGKSSTV